MSNFVQSELREANSYISNKCKFDTNKCIGMPITKFNFKITVVQRWLRTLTRDYYVVILVACELAPREDRKQIRRAKLHVQA